jgi:hypothetical protein
MIFISSWRRRRRGEVEGLEGGVFPVTLSPSLASDDVPLLAIRSLETDVLP